MRALTTDKWSLLDEEGRLALGKFPSIKDERNVTRAEVLALKDLVDPEQFKGPGDL